MNKQKNCEIGSVFAIETSIGYALFQCVDIDEPGIDVVRVLQPILPTIDMFTPNLIQTKERYFIKMTVSAAQKRKLITFIGKYPIPNSVIVPQKYRMLDYVPKRNIRNWYIVDGQTNKLQYVPIINDKFLALSSHGIWNDTLLRERIEEGWSLEDWK